MPVTSRRGRRRPFGRRRRDHLHFKTRSGRSGRRFPIRTVVVVLLLIVLVFAADSIRAAFESAPQLTYRTELAAAKILPGRAPAPAWPSTGQAAVEVEGLPALGATGNETPVPIASLAKVMTAYVVLQSHPLLAGQSGFTLTVTAADVADYDTRAAEAQSVVAVSPGETLTELQLLEGLLIPSANNFAAILADDVAGSSSAFVAQMNSWAARLGMTHTTYTDPAGLDATTVSTASDQLILAARAMANPVLARIVGMSSVNLPTAGVVDNFNTSVGTAGYIGIKTGSDSEAGGCLAFANQQTISGHKVTILGVVLGQDAGVVSTSQLIAAAVNAANALVASVRSAVSVHTVVARNTVVAVVVNPQGHHVALETTSPLREVGYGDERVALAVSLRPAGTRLSAGEEMGTVTAGPGGASTSVVASSAMPAVTFSWKLLHDF